MKKLLVLVAVIAMVFTLCSCAIEPMGARYEVNEDGTTAALKRFNGKSDVKSYVVEETFEFKGVELPVTKLSRFSFSSQENIESITISKNVSEIDPWSFTYCPKLKEINVSPDNMHFESKDGVLFTKGGETLLAYPDAKGTSDDKKGNDYIIPDGTLKIGENAFYRCSKLYTVKIPEGITEIGARAFIRNENLAPPTLPESLTKIGQDAFSYCRTADSNEFKSRNVPSVITIPENVVEIGDYAFIGSGLTEINMRRESTDGMTIGYKWLPLARGSAVITIPVIWGYKG